jgi:hypothetical protein
MTTSEPIHIRPRANGLLARARRPVGEAAPRSCKLDRELLDEILGAIGSTGPRLDRRRVLEAWAKIDRAEPADVALAEHLEADLTTEESQAIALRAARMVPRALAARALGRSEAELAELEAAAAGKAAALTLSYHEDMICEPAALAQADSPQQRTEAVQGHISACRWCRAEFGARVAVVLRHAGALAEPTAPIAVE